MGARVWDVASGTCVQSLSGHTSWVRSAKFDPCNSSRVVTASGDNTAKVWDTTGKCLITLTGHTDWLRVASFSDDGCQIVTSSKDGTARVWCPSSGCCLRTLNHGVWVRSAAFAPSSLDPRIHAGYESVQRVPRVLGRSVSLGSNP